MTETGPLAAALAVAQRDVLLAARRKSDALAPLVFFVIVASLFPLGIGSEPETLRRVAPGVLWMSALLATMLSLPRLFSADYEDGTLEQLALSPQPLPLLVAGKVAAQLLTCGVPLLLTTPIIALQYGLPFDAFAVLLATLALGIPVLSLVGAIGAALALGTRGATLLLPTIALPLYVPTLIFGAGAVEAKLSGTTYEAHLSLLAAYLVIAAFLAPWAIAASVRISLE